MTSESKQLTGLELRKACLIAAGWKVEVSRITGYWGFVKPDGSITSEVFRNDSDGGDYYGLNTEDEAWLETPAVESSVDAALEYLTFPPNMQLDLNSPTYNGKLWYVELHFSPSFSPQYYAYEENPAVGICRVWLQWKTA